MKTILIVDDIYENLYLLKVILEEAGYNIIEATDGKEGLDKLHKNKIDLIISDILMPVMDGYMFCQACKKDKAFKNIPFVFYTSTYTEKLDEEFALKLGAIHFLRKPTDSDTIIKIVNDILQDYKPPSKQEKKPEFTEQEVLKLYSKRLISKLEQKNLDLENEILERTQAENKLKLAKEFTDKLIMSMQEGLLIVNLEGEIIMVNNSLCEIVGYTKNELQGLNLPYPFAKTEDLEKMLAIKEAVIKGEAKSFQLEFLKKNGEMFVASFLSGNILDDKGEVIALFGTIKDVSEEEKAKKNLVLANKALKKANEELNLLRHQLEQENFYLRNEIDLVFNYEDMVYGSAEFSNVLTEVEKVAPTNATVMLLGESGTGKELLARAVHNTSLRNNKPLIKVNCSAIPRELLESELFGHKKGSFTGAFSDKIGKFELADGGTLFLDEIGELPLDMQPKILRFLQEGEIEVVGGIGTKKLDVRIITATNRNLKEEIEKKQFREDLYFRINVFPIEVPPLRKRKEDIPLLIEHFVDKFNKAYDKGIKLIPADTMNQLKSYDWPGNIRELENLIERAAILSNGETLLIPGFESVAQKAKQPINNKDVTLDTFQRNHILKVLTQCHWKIDGENGASKLLDIKPSTLRDRMHKLGIKKPEKK